jgi:hypothetical protein
MTVNADQNACGKKGPGSRRLLIGFNPRNRAKLYLSPEKRLLLIAIQEHLGRHSWSGRDY